MRQGAQSRHRVMLALLLAFLLLPVIALLGFFSAGAVLSSPAALPHHADLLVVLGGGDGYRYPEAHAMAIFLVDLGVPSQAMVLEERSRTTRDNAAFSATLLKARGINHILLVTSALHMPRALALFSRQGLQVIPAATDFEGIQAPPPGIQAWLPDALAMDGSGRAMKEVVGRLVGW